MKAIKNFGLMFVESAHSFKKLNKLIVISLFIALIVVGNLIRVPIIAGSLEIRFGFVFMSATAFLFGPVVACTSGIFADLLAYLINPGGAFHIGFTLNAALGGLIYGIFLYKRNPSSQYFIIYILLAKTLVNFAINIVLTPIWLYGLFGSAGKMITLVRLYKNIVMLPIEIIIIAVVLKSLSLIVKKSNLFDI